MTATLALLLTAFVAQDKSDTVSNDARKVHPYAAAKVGDWITYEMKGPSPNAEAMTEKHTVAKKTDDEVTLKVEFKVGEREMPASERTINLKEAWDPSKPPGAFRKTQPKIPKNSNPGMKR